MKCIIIIILMFGCLGDFHSMNSVPSIVTPSQTCNAQKSPWNCWSKRSFSPDASSAFAWIVSQKEKKNGESGEQENRTTITESGSKPVRRVHRKLSCCWKDSNWSSWSEPLKLQLCLDQLFNVPTQLSHLFSVLTTMPMLFSGEPLWVLIVFTFFAKCLF